jgi:hypothetical protein
MLGDAETQHQMNLVRLPDDQSGDSSLSSSLSQTDQPPLIDSIRAGYKNMPRKYRHPWMMEMMQPGSDLTAR